MDAAGIFGEVFTPGKNIVYYNFKHFRAPDWSTFDYAPRLVRGEVKRQPKSMELGEAVVTPGASCHDPWSEVEIARVLGATYAVGDLSMLKAKVVAEADPATFVPYAFMKGD